MDDQKRKILLYVGLSLMSIGFFNMIFLLAVFMHGANMFYFVMAQAVMALTGVVLHNWVSGR